MEKFKKGEYAGCYQRRVMTPIYRSANFSSLDSPLRKSGQFLKKIQNLDESLKSTSSDSKKLHPTRFANSRLSKDNARTEKSINLTSLISTLMTKYLGIKEKDDQSKPGTPDSSKYFELKEKKKRLQQKKAENTVLIFNPDYYKRDYIGYFTDVGRTVEMEKYIGQNLLKKRKQTAFLNRVGRV